jgi:plasmid stabilization system protein ParE
MIGSDQSHIKQYVRCQVYESHAIYYRADTKTIFILRILGPGENPVRHIK